MTFRRRKGVSFCRYVLLGVEEGGESFTPATSQFGFQISDGSIGFGQPMHAQERCQRSIDPLIRPSAFPRNYGNVAVLRERVCRESRWAVGQSPFWYPMGLFTSAGPRGPDWFERNCGSRSVCDVSEHPRSVPTSIHPRNTKGMVFRITEHV